MKKIRLFIILLIFSELVFSQNKSTENEKRCYLLDSIMNSNILLDSVTSHKLLARYIGAKIVFIDDKAIQIFWKKYSISGSYLLNNETKFLKIKFRRRKFNYYENGTIERSLFASFLTILINKLELSNDKGLKFRDNSTFNTTQIYFEPCK